MDPPIKSDTKKVIVWDTSALNKLRLMSDHVALIESIQCSYQNWIPAYAIRECIATRNESHRLDLRRVCRKLTSGYGRVLRSPTQLLDFGIAEFRNSRKITIEHVFFNRELEENLSSSSLIEKKFSQTLRKSAKDAFAESKTNAVRARNQIKTLYESGIENPPNSYQELLTRDPVVSVAAILAKKRGWNPSSDELQKLMDHFRSLKSFSVAQLLGNYYRLICGIDKTPNITDVSASVYLPICDIFLTDDHEQQKLFRAICEMDKLKTEIVWFQGDFIKRFKLST